MSHRVDQLATYEKIQCHKCLIASCIKYSMTAIHEKYQCSYQFHFLSFHQINGVKQPLCMWLVLFIIALKSHSDKINARHCFFFQTSVKHNNNKRLFPS